MTDACTVTFRFKLPGVLLLRAEIGAWSRSPKGVVCDVTRDGTVTISCTNWSELHARGMVISTAASFMRRIDNGIPPTAIPAKLSGAPSAKGREIDYAITLGARISIARTGEAPEVFGNPLLAVV